MAITYKKSLGQNFIYDLALLQRMVAPLKITANDWVVEVGTGAGTLTKVMAATGCHLRTIELDRSLAPILEKELGGLPNVELVFGDALKQDLQSLPNFNLVANVPYYITTPLLMKFLDLPNCLTLNVLVAEEVAKRIVASVGTAAYSALSVACQLQAKCEILQRVPRTVFTPQPKIDSAFVRLVKTQFQCEPDFGRLLKGIFAARRKTMLNALAGAISVNKVQAEEILRTAQVDVSKRPEEISPTEYWQIYQITRNYDK